MLTQFEFKQKLDMVTEGLFARVKINMDRYSEYSVDRNYKPFFYNIGTSDLLTNSYTLIRLNPSEGTEYIDYNPGNRYIDTSFYLEAAAEYNRTFEDKHTVNALLVYTMRNKSQVLQTICNFLCPTVISVWPDVWLIITIAAILQSSTLVITVLSVLPKTIVGDSSPL